jgi:ligand-binding sensor domain-containing protein
MSSSNRATGSFITRVASPLAFLIIVCHLSLSASAQQLSIRRYTTRDGLAHNRVTSIHQDRKGYMWVGTYEGLSRFDGYRFINYDTRDGLSHSVINDITEDRRGRLWVATNGGGVSRFVDEPGAGALPTEARRKFVSFPVNEASGSNRVNRLLFDSNENLWCTTDGGVYRAEARSLEADAPRFLLVLSGISPSGVTQAALCDRLGRLWFGVANELIEIVDGQVIRYGAADGLAREGASSIAEDNKGRLLAAGDHNVFEFSNPTDGTNRGRWYRIPMNPTLKQDINFVAFDSTGALWICIWGGGVTKLVDGKLTTYAAAHGLGDSQVMTVREDRDGNLWMATYSSGVCKLSGETIVSFTKSEGLPELSAYKIIEDSAGRVYASTGSAGLVRIEEGRVVPIQGSQAPRFARTRYRIAQDQRGRWWVGTDSALFRFDEADLRFRKGKRLTAANGIPAVAINCVYGDPEGRVWVTAADLNLYCFDPRQDQGRCVACAAVKATLPFGSVYSIIRDQSGAIWLGTQEHLGRLKNGVVTMFEPTEGLPETDPRVFYTDSRGWLWIGLRNKGVSMTTDPTSERPAFVNYSMQTGLGSNTVWAIAEDDAGRMYFGTGRGLDRLDLSTGRVRHLATADGLGGEVINSCLKDSQGNIWIGSAGGLSRFNPHRERSVDNPAPIYLSRIQIAGEDQRIAETGATVIPGLELPASRNNLLIEYVGLDFHGERALKYQYKLEGVDSDWSAPTDQRSVNYARLSHGSYRFLVRAINEEGITSLEPAAIEFRILPPVWQRWWFLVLAATFVSLIIYLTYRYRLAQLIALERVRVRIASDLHDDIGSNLSLIAGLSEVLGQQARRTEPQISDKLSLIASVSRKSVDAMSDIVWAVNPNKDHLRDLTQRMRRFASDAFTARGIEFHFDAPDSAHDAKIGAEVRREVFLIFKEGVNNIARHSRCTLAEISLQLDRGMILLKMCDNGKGFDVARVDPGQGLASMRKRAERLGGELAVISSPDRGATLILKAALK